MYTQLDNSFAQRLCWVSTRSIESHAGGPAEVSALQPSGELEFVLFEHTFCFFDNDVQLAGANKQPVQGCDPAVLYRTDDDLKEIVKKLPHRPLEATMNRWKLRTASPSMKDYIRRVRRDIDADGPSKFFLPWNLRDTLMVKKERLLAQGPYENRKFIIDSYRLKKIQEQWKIDAEQSKRSKWTK